MIFKNFTIIVSSLLLLAGCGTNIISDGPEKTGSTITSNDIIDIHGNVKNLERLDVFMQHLKNGETDEIRVTHYTIEGDPIYDEVIFDGKQLSITNDTTEDEFGPKERTTYTCQNIERNETNKTLEYMLIDCELEEQKGNHPLISIDYNLEAQDYFGFRLEYGVDRKNVIDTKAMELKKDLQNGEMVAVSDFQFTDSELQEIYKLIVLAGYLSEKEVSTSCQAEPLTSYKLTVWINQGMREFEWNRCDSSEDGKQMTQLVDDIVKVLKNNHIYKELPEVKGEYQ
ncbi:DUF4362 domain-containing protein [Neobacillus sp. D3-1R]|uniref:DUF4362 domain-containing protein n=1 Tax=Neobacillus sp. D3-1R TaxID=3445778 RepID=UPI003FA0F007